MAIDITCTQCKKLLRLNEKLAGKRIKCPSCQTVLQVPAASSASSPKQPAELWHLKTEDEQYHGPMARPELDRWVAEGRLTMNCQVLRDGAGVAWRLCTKPINPHSNASSLSKSSMRTMP